MARMHRARSLPNARPFRIAVFFYALFCLGLIAVATAFASFLIHPNRTAGLMMLSGAAFSALAWLLAFMKRRHVFCPLCKGTPLVNSGARTHVRAWRIPPLSHGTSAMLSILATQKFRCMYCGSSYDLLKPPTRLLLGTDAES